MADLTAHAARWSLRVARHIFQRGLKHNAILARGRDCSASFNYGGCLMKTPNFVVSI